MSFTKVSLWYLRNEWLTHNMICIDVFWCHELSTQWRLAHTLSTNDQHSSQLTLLLLLLQLENTGTAAPTVSWQLTGSVAAASLTVSSWWWTAAAGLTWCWSRVCSAWPGWAATWPGRVGSVVVTMRGGVTVSRLSWSSRWDTGSWSSPRLETVSVIDHLLTWKHEENLLNCWWRNFYQVWSFCGFRLNLTEA